MGYNVGQEDGRFQFTFQAVPGYGNGLVGFDDVRLDPGLCSQNGKSGLTSCVYSFKTKDKSNVVSSIGKNVSFRCCLNDNGQFKHQTVVAT